MSHKLLQVRVVGLKREFKGGCTVFVTTIAMFWSKQQNGGLKTVL